MLSNHQATEEEKTKICDWKYEGEYALYNTVSYEEMKNRKFGFGNSQMYVESFLITMNWLVFAIYLTMEMKSSLVSV